MNDCERCGQRWQGSHRCGPEKSIDQRTVEALERIATALEGDATGPQRMCPCGRVWDNPKQAIECATADALGVEVME